MDKTLISKLIVSNSERITYSENTGTSSSAWNDFVKVNVDGAFAQYIKCLHCSMLLKWKQRDGTSGLINHSKSCAKNKTLTARDRTLKDVGAVVVSQTKQKILPASLKSEVDDEMKALATSSSISKNLARCLVDVNEALLKDIIKVLEPFDSATKLLSADHRPTIHLVAATMYKLSMQLNASPTDTEVVRSFKKHLRQNLIRYATVTDYHHLAALLDPRMKQNRNIMDSQARQSAVSSLRKLVDEAIICSLVTKEVEDRQKPCDSDGMPAPPKKKANVVVLYLLYKFNVL